MQQQQQRNGRRNKIAKKTMMYRLFSFTFANALNILCYVQSTRATSSASLLLPGHESKTIRAMLWCLVFCKRSGVVVFLALFATYH